MEGPEEKRSLWKNLRQRLRSKGMMMMMGFCGSSSFRHQVVDMPTAVENEQTLEQILDFYDDESTITGVLVDISAAEVAPPCGDSIPARQSINLATALAVERRRTEETPVTPSLKSLISLFEEMDGLDCEEKNGGLGGACCVCMERSKGAALIPCGHTYCRVCSREVLLNRGSCPLCNKPIQEVLDIF